MSKSIKAWHFTGDELLDGRPIPPIGTKIVHDGELILGKSGFHASIDPFDALMYAQGTVLHYVKCGCEVLHGNSRLVSSELTILESHDVAKELRLFACHCVRHTPLSDGRTVWDLLTDERSRIVVEVVERFAHGKATSEELATAGDAARDAAQAAEWAATWDADCAADCAAECAAVWDDVWDDAWAAVWADAWAAATNAADAAARATAWNAAMAASGVAAWDDADAAARDAEWNAAWDDAWNDARKWQRTEFNKVVATAFNTRQKQGETK